MYELGEIVVVNHLSELEGMIGAVVAIFPLGEVEIIADGLRHRFSTLELGRYQNHRKGEKR